MKEKLKNKSSKTTAIIKIRKPKEKKTAQLAIELDLDEFARSHRYRKLAGVRRSRALQLRRSDPTGLAGTAAASPWAALAAQAVVPLGTNRTELPPLLGRRCRSAPPP